jgi:hypothetical protein
VRIARELGLDRATYPLKEAFRHLGVSDRYGYDHFELLSLSAKTGARSTRAITSDCDTPAPIILITMPKIRTLHELEPEKRGFRWWTPHLPFPGVNTYKYTGIDGIH